jgi:hypothetical protein
MRISPLNGKRAAAYALGLALCGAGLFWIVKRCFAIGAPLLAASLLGLPPFFSKKRVTPLSSPAPIPRNPTLDELNKLPPYQLLASIGDLGTLDSRIPRDSFFYTILSQALPLKNDDEALRSLRFSYNGKSYGWGRALYQARKLLRDQRVFGH